MRWPAWLAGGETRQKAAPREPLGLFHLAALGALTSLVTLSIPVIFHTFGDNGYMAAALATGVLAIVATQVAARTARPQQALLLIVGVAIGLRIVLLFTDPLLSTDIYRYVWDGRVQAAGINPYRFVPADTALAPLRDAAIFPNINRADYAVTIYPPMAQVFFFLVTRLGETVTMMKLALLGCEAVTVALIIVLLRQLGRPATRVVAYLWHPLPMWEIANSGHIDALMVALMMLGLWLALQARPLRGAAVMTLAALAKPFALLALPPLWRPWDWRMPATVVGVAALSYVPYASVGTGVLGFLSTGYLQEENLVSGNTVLPLAGWRMLFGVLRGDSAVYWAVVLLVIGAMSLMAAYRHPRSEAATLADIHRLLLVALLLISPNYPWYFLVLTPFVALTGGATLWIATVGAVLLQEEAPWDPHIPILIRKSVFYGAISIAALFALWRVFRLWQSQRRPQS